MLSHEFRRFLRDERGSYTIWSLIWFLMYVAIGGLAVDMTDAYQKEHLLQASADAAALAGVMSLATEGENPTIAAVTYARENMDPDIHGKVLAAQDVRIGTWDFDSEIFYEGTLDPNAVYVTTRRHEQNQNPVAMNFLRVLSLLGMDTWFNINAEAIAVMYHPDCVTDGFVAYGEVYFRSNNDFYRDICIHGQMNGVSGRMGNIYEDGVSITHGPTGEYDFPPGAYNDDLYTALNGTDNIWPSEAYSENVSATIEYLSTLPSNVGDLNSTYATWDYLYRAQNADGTAVVGADGEYVYAEGGVTHETYSGGALPSEWNPNTVYHFEDCGQINLGSDIELARLVIIAGCRIHSAASTSAGNVIFASTYSGGADAVHLAAESGLGYADFCTNGEGGVEVYTLGDVHMAAQGEWHGLRVTASGNVDFTSNNDGAYGIAVQSGGDINFRSNNKFGLCEGDYTNGPIVWRFRLVR